MKTIYLPFVKATNELIGIISSPKRIEGFDDSYNVIKADYIGKGMFCNAFKGYDGNVYLLIKQFKDDFDYSKEAISQWADDDNKHIPSIESFGQYTVNGIEYLVFKMPFYEKLNAKKHSQAWKVFKELQNKWNMHHYGYKYKQEPFYRDSFNKAYDFLETLEESEYKEALDSILSAGSNYGCEYGLEFSKINVSVDKDGNLIFRDVLFNAELCVKIREARKPRQYARAY